MSRPRLPTTLFDRMAVALSTVCLLHCLAVPFIVTVVPLVGSALVPDQAFHWLLLVLVLPMSLWALACGCRRHRHLPIGVTGAVGLIILIAVGVAGHGALSEMGERLATSLGSAVVALAHVMNHRLTRANNRSRRG